MSQNVQQLREVAERSFLQGLKYDVTPHVMGCLPDDVELKRQLCLQTGAAEDLVNNTIGEAWQAALSSHRSSAH